MTPEVADIDAAARVCVTTVVAASTARRHNTGMTLILTSQRVDDGAWMMCSIGRHAVALSAKYGSDTECHPALPLLAPWPAWHQQSLRVLLRQRFVPFHVCDGQTGRLTWPCLTATNRSEVSLKSQWSRMERLRACVHGR